MANDRKEAFFKVCPNCKSPDILLDKSSPLSGAAGLPPFYICGKCGFTGSNVIEVAESEIEDFEKQAYEPEPTKIKTPQIDTSLGENIVRVLWKISAPITFFAGISEIYWAYKYGRVQENSVGILIIIPGIILTAIGLFMIYATYIKKPKIAES